MVILSACPICRRRGIIYKTIFLLIKIIKQLTDNYSYIIYSNETKEALILDPAEPKPILDFLNSENLLLQGILVTHHHSDHTQGVFEIKNKLKVRHIPKYTKIMVCII